MANRAPKSGIALEASLRLQAKYDPILAKQILEWVSRRTGENINCSGEADNFARVFADGTMLCRLANALSPGAIKGAGPSKMVFKQMENISKFLEFAGKYVDKTELFQSIDLVEGIDLWGVVTCLSALARKAEKVFNVPGIGPKEAEGQKREWTQAQLRQGDTIIGLQMGSNKGATASGLNMGNTRHM